MNPDFLRLLLAELNQGLWLSLKIIAPSALCGLLIGILAGAVRGSGYPGFLVRPLNAYVALFRGTALLAQIFICYYGLPGLANWMKPFFTDHNLPPLWKIFSLSPYASSVLIFSLCSGAYHSEYIRGAILSIKKGQFQAARALGFSPAQTFWTIVIPQAVRRAWPGCGNEIIYLIKYSSLAFVVSAKELTGAALSVANSTFRFTETFFAAGLYYLIVITAVTWLLNRLEKAFAVPGFGRDL
ncbi:MAG: amino acid ABC transporter permease [Candidatus Adiutrix sp.]|jgi:polar amino acid transport system permease protein|nr:amino acid ABC transporter permease [Candidatus Adiutrix sp.]